MSTASLSERLDTALKRARAISQLPGAGYSVCILDLDRQSVLREWRLSNLTQVSKLAEELDVLGFEPVVTDPNPCDFVFSPVEAFA